METRVEQSGLTINNDSIDRCLIVSFVGRRKKLQRGQTSLKRGKSKISAKKTKRRQTSCVLYSRLTIPQMMVNNGRFGTKQTVGGNGDSRVIAVNCLPT